MPDPNAADGRALAPGSSSGSFDAASREAIRQKKLKTAPSHGWARGLALCDLFQGIFPSCGRPGPASQWDAQGPPQTSSLPLKQPVQNQYRIDLAPASAQGASLHQQAPRQPMVPPAVRAQRAYSCSRACHPAAGTVPASPSTWPSPCRARPLTSAALAACAPPSLPTLQTRASMCQPALGWLEGEIPRRMC